MEEGTIIYKGQMILNGENIEHIEDHIKQYLIFLRKELNGIFDLPGYKETARYHVPNYTEAIKMNDITSLDCVDGTSIDFYVHTGLFSRNDLHSTMEEYIKVFPSEVIKEFIDIEIGVNLHITEFKAGEFTTQAQELVYYFDDAEDIRMRYKVSLSGDYQTSNTKLLKEETDVFYANTVNLEGLQNYMDTLEDICFPKKHRSVLGVHYQLDNEIVQAYTKIYQELDDSIDKQRFLIHLEGITDELYSFNIQEVIDHAVKLSPILAKEMMERKIV